MFCISSGSHDPYFNLAYEEVLLKNRSEDFMILAVNDPCVVIGKHQVPHRESDTRFISNSGIPLIRRISGGGAVFHDHGNLNFSFIISCEEGKQIDFRKYTLPVIKFLSAIGLDVRFEGKSDLKLDGLKVSGNAEHVYRKRVLHHGTLLFESSLDNLRGSLRKDTANYSSRGVESNRSSVMNLREKLDGFGSMAEFSNEMLQWFLKNISGARLYSPESKDVNDASDLVVKKYRTWEWNYAYGPEYYFRSSFYLNSEFLSCRLFVKDGLIWECKIDGSERMAVACKSLIGIPHMPGNILKALKENEVEINDDEVYVFF